MKTILVVDDDENVRTLLRRILEGLGHRVFEAASALDALERLKTGPVNLALCDVLMPGRDGIWLTEQILARHPAVSVALATGLTEMDPTVTLRPGVIGYLVKPFKRQAIVDLLENGLSVPLPTKPADIDLAALDAL